MSGPPVVRVRAPGPAAPVGKLKQLLDVQLTLNDEHEARAMVVFNLVLDITL
jgi:hypothetical protein